MRKLEGNCDNCLYKEYVAELFFEMVKEVKKDRLKRKVLMSLVKEEESSTKPVGDDVT